MTWAMLPITRALLAFGAFGHPDGALSVRQSLKGRQVIRNVMKGLLIDSVDRHLRAAKKAWIVQRADLQNHGG